MLLVYKYRVPGMLREEARAVLFKLERAYESPGGVVKMQTPSQQVWAGLSFSMSGSAQVKADAGQS